MRHIPLATCALLVALAAASTRADQIKGSPAAPISPDAPDHGIVRKTPLLDAIEANDADTVDELIAAGAKVSEADERGTQPIHVAAERGNAEIVQMLLDAGAKADAQKANGIRPIHKAAFRGHAEVVKRLLAAGAQVDVPNQYGEQPLHLAAKKGRADVVKLLLAAGAKATAADKKGRQPIAMAVANEDAAVVNLLLAYGAKIEAAEADVPQLIKDAAQNRQMEWLEVLLSTQQDQAGIVKGLLADGMPVDAADEDGVQLIHYAAVNGQVELFKVLVAAGAKVDAKAKNPKRLILDAARDSEEDLRWGNKRRYWINSLSEAQPIHLAAWTGHLNTIKLLIEAGAKADATTKSNARALFLAARNGHLDVVKFLLASGAKVNAVETIANGRQAIHAACENGNIEVIKTLLAAGARVDAKDGYGCQAIHVATAEGHLELVKFLLSHGAKVDALSGISGAPLHIAVEIHSAEMVKYLLSAGAKIGVWDMWRLPPIAHINASCVYWDLGGAAESPGNITVSNKAKSSGVEVAKILIAAKSDIRYAYKDEAPFSVCGEWSVRSREKELERQSELLCYMIASGMRHDCFSNGINGKFSTDRSCLDLAAEAGDVESVKRLLTAGAKVDAKNKEGRQPLAALCASGTAIPSPFDPMVFDGGSGVARLMSKRRVKVADLLLFSGAKLDVADKEGFYPIHYAAQMGQLGLVKWLVKHGAKIDVTNRKGETALDLAIRQRGLGNLAGNYDQTIAFLTAQGLAASVGQKLYAAVSDGDMSLIKEIIAGGGIDLKGPMAIDSTMLAANNGEDEVVKFLVTSGVPVNAVSRYGNQLIHICARTGHEKLMKFLLVSGAKADSSNEGGWSPIFIAAENGHIGIIKKLIAAGVTVDAENTTGVQVRGCCYVGTDSLEYAKLVREKQSKSKPLKQGGLHPLHFAAMQGRTDVVKLLINEKANVHAPAPWGDQAIHYAAVNGNVEVLKLLLDAGAGVEAKGVAGQRPLHCAATFGNLEAVKFLIKHGAKASTKSNNGSLPDSANPEIHAYLVAQRAKEAEVAKTGK